ncbi:unnamed protein product [Microthlaspi erraticum]|uniref:Importin subunit alpha n=1 Tax=Microthlaspi erraticum TaxID=1685480 RepID=A0A6D2KI04_9BRAS|nr:unnamed protein product [Microthlaspi erraticum]
MVWSREDNIVESKGGDQYFHPSPSASDKAINSNSLKLDMTVAGCWSDDSSLQLESTTLFRKLSTERLPPIEQVISSGLVPRFVSFLMKEDHPQLQCEAARALTNITLAPPSHHTGPFCKLKTSDNTQLLINHNAVPIFVKMLSSPRDDIRELAVEALGHVARDSPQSRDLVLACGAMTPLLNQLKMHGPCNFSMIEITSWTLVQLCRQWPDQVICALPALVWFIYMNDAQVLKDSCVIISNLYYEPEEVISSRCKPVVDAGLVARFVELLHHPSRAVNCAALLSISAVTTDNCQQIQTVINSGALPLLRDFLTRGCKEEIARCACLAIRRITRGTNDQIKAVIDAGLIPLLVTLSQNAQLVCQEVAALAIANAIIYAPYDQISVLLEQGCTKPICDLLVSTHPRVLSTCLDALGKILRCGGRYAALIDDKAEAIEKLKSHEDRDVFNRAYDICESWSYSY